MGAVNFCSRARSVLVAFALSASVCFAALEPFPFHSPQQRVQFERLTQELRCLVCQNQSLADSNASLASDLRQEVFRRILAGQSDETIRDYLVGRYGPFILFRPPWMVSTYLLWIGPFILLLLGIVGAFYVLRRDP